jgi:hypothetical protein
MREALDDIDWAVSEITSHKFMEPKGNLVNESFGYKLKVPKLLSHIRKLWVGYVCHEKAPPGIYAGLTALPASESTPAHKNGYKMSPFEDFILLKQIVPQEKLAEMEKQFGSEELKERMKEIIKTVYPFSKR